MTPEAPTPDSPPEEIHFSRGKTVLYSAVAVLLGLSVIEAVSVVIWTTIVPDRLVAQAEEVPVRFGMVNFPDIVEKDPWLFWQLKAITTAPLDQGKMTGFIANGDRMRNPAGLRIVAGALFDLLVERDMLPEPVAAPGAQAPRR